MKSLKDCFLNEAKKLKEPILGKKYKDTDKKLWTVEEYEVFGPGDLTEEGGLADGILNYYDEDGYMSQKIGEGYYDEDSGIICGCTDGSSNIVYMFDGKELYR